MTGHCKRHDLRKYALRGCGYLFYGGALLVVVMLSGCTFIPDSLRPAILYGEGTAEVLKNLPETPAALDRKQANEASETNEADETGATSEAGEADKAPPRTMTDETESDLSHVFEEFSGTSATNEPPAGEPSADRPSADMPPAESTPAAERPVLDTEPDSDREPAQ